MKTLYTLFVAMFILSVHSSYAQSVPTFGLRTGVTVSGMRGDALNNLNGLIDLTGGVVNTETRTGFHAGAYMNVPVTGAVSFEPGIYYSQKGFSMKGGFDLKGLEFLGANASAELQASYIDMPLLLKIELVNGLHLFAGPQVSYLVKNNLQVEAGALGLSLFKRNIDVTNQFAKWDASVSGGLAYQFANGFNIQAGYDHGLSRVDANSRFKSYNTAVKLGVGFSF